MNTKRLFLVAPGAAAFVTFMLAGTLSPGRVEARAPSMFYCAFGERCRIQAPAHLKNQSGLRVRFKGKKGNFTRAVSSLGKGVLQTSIKEGVWGGDYSVELYKGKKVVYQFGTKVRVYCTEAYFDHDGDGHNNVRCVTKQGKEIRSDDCDDYDVSRYPGNSEQCSGVKPDSHDEDCNPHTFGKRDKDGDGFTDSRCCNGKNCGSDCDDTRRSVHPNQNEACNGLDDNCNGKRDEGVQARAFKDRDRDTFGNPKSSKLMCVHKLSSGWVLNKDDCDDSDPKKNPIAGCN